jgi:hypothetical protein
MSATWPAAQAPERAVAQPEEQIAYARLLDWGTRAGLLLLVLVFAAYGLGLVDPQVPHERLAEVWNLPVSAFLQATGMPRGWGWLRLAHRGDVANLLGISLLAGCSLLALLAQVPLYLKRGDRVYAALCLAEVAVVVLAASGLIGAGH